ncbi:MAG: phosphotransferase family protein [Aliarcobacter sp.]|nr:phosphotransferase family protein [Aliarcobacter sp.]
MNLESLRSYNIFKEELLSLDLLKNQGFNNISYLLKTSSKSYVIRVFKSNESVNISRKFEYEIQKKAYKKNIASKPIFLNENFMIYEYEKGIHKTKLSTLELKNLVLKIKKFHNFKVKTKAYDIKKDLLNYDKNLNDFKSKKLINESRRNLFLLKRFKKDLVLTHHDLNPKNIIFRNNNIAIIDWEYAGLNDCFFDLASVCIEFSLNEKNEKLILKNYFNHYKKNHIQKLNHFKIIYKNLCDLWFRCY